MATSTPKDADHRRCPAPDAAPSESCPPGAADYLTLCFRCHRVVILSPADAVVAEARAVIGDITIVFCGDCIREAALRMVDGG